MIAAGCQATGRGTRGPGRWMVVVATRTLSAWTRVIGIIYCLAGSLGKPRGGP